MLIFRKRNAMKKTLSFIALCFAINAIHAQVFVNGTNLNADSSIMYFEINYDPRSAFFFTAEVDYGKGDPWRRHITDSTRKKMRFNSGVDLLNFITKNGWKLADRQFIPTKYDHSAGTGNLSSSIEIKEMTMYVLFERVR